MSDLQRMRQLAGLTMLKENVQAVPGIGQVKAGDLVNPRWSPNGEAMSVVAVLPSGKVIVKDEFGNKGTIPVSDLVSANPIDEEITSKQIDAAQNDIDLDQGSQFMESEIDETAPPGEEKLVKKLKKEYPGEEDKAFATAWSIYDKKHGKKEESVDENIESPAQIVSCNQDNPASARDACAMEESVLGNFDRNFIIPTIEQVSRYATTMDELVKLVAKETGYEVTPEFSDMVTREYNKHMGHEQEIEPVDDYTDRSMRRGEMGLEEDIQLGDNNADAPGWYIIRHSDNKIGSGPFDDAQQAKSASRTKEWFDPTTMSVEFGVDDGDGNFVQDDLPGFDRMKEAYDLNNGYGDEKCLDGDDYFPTGADSPVVGKVGPSGARQGDNPEQKKMEVTETHKELVYAYRNFLKESAQLNELSKDILNSYAKKKGAVIRADKGDADRSREQAKYAAKNGDHKSEAGWNDDADWLDKRAEKGGGKVANAVIKAAKKK